MSMRKRKAIGIKNLGARARTRKSMEAVKVSTSSKPEDVNQPIRPPTFLEAYESAQKRISDLANRRERVLAEITQPATLKSVRRRPHPASSMLPTEAGSSAAAVVSPVRAEPLPEAIPIATVPAELLPEATHIPTCVRISARLKTQHSEVSPQPEHHDRIHQPVTGSSAAERSDSAPLPEMDEESEEEGEEESAGEEKGEEEGVGESDEEDEELIAMRRRVNEMGDGLMHAGRLLQEQACTADATWIKETLKRADRPGSSGELHAILFSRSIKRA